MRNRVLFSGYYGLGNAGDEAVLAGLIRGIRESGLPAELTVLSAWPALTEKWHRVRAVPRMRPALIAAVADCDVLVSGGGSLLQDVTSFTSLTYYLAVIGIAKAMGKPVAVAAQGMGPLTRAASRRWVGSVVGRADLITVRDTESADLLRRCGVRRPVHVTADPAFLLHPTSLRPAERMPAGSMPPSTDPPAWEAAPREGPVIGIGRRIGVAVRAWPGRDLVEWGAGLCRGLAARGVVPVLIPMQEPQDRRLAGEIRAAATGTAVARMPAGPAPNRPGATGSAPIRSAAGPIEIRGAAGGPVEIAPLPDRLDDVTRAIWGCDALIGMRLHALLLAANAGLPVVAWSYDPKVDALMRALGREEGLLPLSARPDEAARAAVDALDHPADPERIEGLRRDARRTIELLSNLIAPT